VSDLPVKITKGLFWNLVENFGVQFVQFLISIILARLLLPEQFGLIGMLALFMALAQSFLDSGFGSALIQRKNVSHLDTCSVFYFNLLIGIFLTLLLYGTAPIIARFYHEPLLTKLTRFLSLNIIINAFCLVPSVIINKRMDFKSQFKVNVISMVISGVLGLVLALMGKGVWSLAVQSVLNTLVRAILLWLVSRWRPSLTFSAVSLATMFSFGSRMMLSGLLDTFFQNIYQPLIGRLYSAADVGYFVRAQNLQSIAVQPAGFALGRVIFPALTPIQDDQARLRRVTQKIITTAMFLQFPFVFGLIVVAAPLITLLLTERWAPSIFYFQLFCLVGLLYPMHINNLVILQVMGRSDFFFRLEVIKKLMVLITIVITYRWGVVAMLYGQIVVSVVGYFFNGYYSARLIGYSSLQQIRDVSPFLIISLLMGVSMYLVGGAVGSLLLKLIVQSVVGATVYLILNYVFHRSELTEIARLAMGTIGLLAGRK
jgi:O-antigen/teichoic acid export membrane protein